MQDGDKLGKIQQKADNILKTSGNKLSRNSAILNKKNSIDKFNLLMSKQEAGKSKKMKNGGYKKMANGGDVPPTMSMDEYMKYQEGSNSFATDISPFIKNPNQPVTQQGMWNS